MIALTDDVRQALAGEMTPKFLATLDAEGRPNCVPVITLTPFDDDTLIFAEFFLHKSRRNLQACQKVGIAVVTEDLYAWSLKGVFEGFETSGPRFDWASNLPLVRYNAYTNARAAGTIRIESVSSMHSLSKGQVLRDFLYLRAMSIMHPFKRDRHPCMPPRVMQKFRRLAAIRAAAFRDTDGYPRAFAAMGCLAAGPNRLLLRDALAAPYVSAIPSGTPMAVAVLTLDPVAYQVKGTYQGRRAGTGLIDLDACYSASPPLLGERLNTAEPVLG